MVRMEVCGPALAACGQRCPLSLCIQGYVGHIAAGEYAEAFGHIMSRTPLPESVCRVCHAPCEDVCVRGPADGPVAINALKRFVLDWATRQEHDHYRPEREPDNGMKVAIIGAGPSGLSAAQDLFLRGYAVTLFDAAERPGGLLAYGIPGYRLPPEAVERDVARILDLGVTFIGGTRLGRDIHIDALLDGEFDAVYIAMGASRTVSLDLPGTDGSGAPTVVMALEYLGSIARGEDVETGRRVVVVGGGNAAIDASRTAIRRGAESVSLACLESLEEMPAIREEIRAARMEGVEFHTELRPVRIRSRGIVFASIDADSAAETRFEVDQIILAIGQFADLEGFEPDGLDLVRTPDGYLQVDPENGRTSHPRVFAGGDLVKGEQTVTGAIAAGLRAAWGIDTELRDPSRADRRPPPRHVSPLEEIPEPLSVPEWSRAERVVPEKRPPETRCRNFEEVVGTLSEAQARAEAARCLMCGQCGNCRACIDLFGCPAIQEDEDGRTMIDPILCSGCGVCAALCPNGAIRVVTND
jgi:NADPH-dependent glutamate synthase beta subunit-like oxidoreductase